MSQHKRRGLMEQELLHICLS